MRHSTYNLLQIEVTPSVFMTYGKQQKWNVYNKVSLSLLTMQKLLKGTIKIESD